MIAEFELQTADLEQRTEIREAGMRKVELEGWWYSTYLPIPCAPGLEPHACPSRYALCAMRPALSP